MSTSYLFLYCFFSVLQIYLYFGIGVMTYTRKLYTMETVKKFTAMLYYCFIPIYAFMEISDVISIQTVKVYWILILSTALCIFLGYIFARIFHHACCLEERISESFSLTLAFPAVGSLPLVLAKFMCYPGGPLEGEPSCSNATGLMIVNFFIYMCLLHTGALNLVKKDKNLNDSINQKLRYLWHIILKKFGLKDYFALLICEKYLDDPKLRVSIYNNFVENFSLEADDNYKFKIILDKEKLTIECKVLKEEENKEIEMNKIENKKFKDKKFIVQESICNTKINILTKEIIPQNNNEENCSIDNNFKNPNIIDPNIIDLGINIHMKELPIDRMKSILVTIKDEKAIDNEEYFNTSGFEENVNNYVEKIRKIESVKILDKKIINELRNSFRGAKNFHSFNLNRGGSNNNLNIIIEEKKENEVKPEAILNDYIEIKSNFSNETPIIIHENSSNKTEIEIYYKTLFDTIEEHLDEDKKNSFGEYKEQILKNIRKEISTFPIIEGIYIPIKRIRIIDEEWSKLEEYCRKNNFELIMEGLENKISWNVVISKLFSPPIIGCLVGIIFGLSSMKSVLYSTNHYIYNIIGILKITYKAYVPLLFMCTGISLTASKGLSLNTPFSKLHLMLSFLVRAVFIPYLGLVFIYIMKTYYGGIVETDRMFRFAMFVVWTLPASPNFVVVVDLINHFRDELSYVIFWHNMFIFLNLTGILIVYFLTVG